MSLDSTGSRSLEQAGRGVVCVVAALMAIGVVMIASTSATLDRPATETVIWKTPLARQVGFGILGVLTLVIVARAGLPLVTPARSSARAPRLMPLVMLLFTCGLPPE